MRALESDDDATAPEAAATTAPPAVTAETASDTRPGAGGGGGRHGRLDEPRERQRAVCQAGEGHAHGSFARCGGGQRAAAAAARRGAGLERATHVGSTATH